MKITEDTIIKFKNHLIAEEKSEATIKKYIRDVTTFFLWVKEREVTKELALEYKKQIFGEYAPKSVNSMLSSLNMFFVFMGRPELKIKMLKIQRQIFAGHDKELTKEEYARLCGAAKNKNNERLYLIMQTVCSTGLRVSEIKYITTDAVKCGHTTISCKGKLRQVFLSEKLCQILAEYIKKQNIKSGAVFVTKSGKPMDRSNIWKMMVSVGKQARVPKEKVFPHNLRHLFARTYYNQEKDIVRLADILGHSSVDTTRIYTMENGDEHKRQIERLGLLM